MLIASASITFSVSAFEQNNTPHHFEHHLHNNNSNSNNNNNVDFHQAFHRQQRASHRAIFGPEHSSHNRLNNNNNNNNNDHLFGRPPRAKTSSRPAREFVSAWRSDDEHSNSNLHRLSERWRRSRSNPPRGRHWLDSSDGFNDRRHRHFHNHNNRWRATSHGDLARALNDDSADEDFIGGQSHRLPAFGFRSSHDLHAANEARASRSDLRDIREQLLHRSAGSHNDLRASRRSISKPWETECLTCTGVLNRPFDRPRPNQNFHSYNPRSPSIDSDELVTHRHQGLFRY